MLPPPLPPRKVILAPVAATRLVGMAATPPLLWTARRPRSSSLTFDEANKALSLTFMKTIESHFGTPIHFGQGHGKAAAGPWSVMTHAWTTAVILCQAGSDSEHYGW
mmetsp:Transcript_17641/g.53008  ORF Transcript_17641/g.53008 Transcript_17641/m.53008 type:complete len:107 (-) Transcript_17641:351-671(-)